VAARAVCKTIPGIASVTNPPATSDNREKTMRFDEHRVVITAAGRDFGRTLAIAFASRGAEVFLSARMLHAAERTRDEIRQLGHTRVHAFACDLTDPISITGFAQQVAERTDHIDVLVNNGARYLDGVDLMAVTDGDVVDTIASGAAGTILATKHFLPLLLQSSKPDIVTMISSAGIVGHHRSDAHAAFYSAKAAQAGFTEILSKRLRPRGVRVISLYPPDFANPDPLSPDWQTTPRGHDTPLTSQSLTDCILFAIGQPRDCFIKAFHFEEPC
jgi:NAD(P)-dependent dehydrogenase (short-subunit alcohol dehydrogenase family)